MFAWTQASRIMNVFHSFDCDSETRKIKRSFSRLQKIQHAQENKVSECEANLSSGSDNDSVHLLKCLPECLLSSDRSLWGALRINLPRLQVDSAWSRQCCQHRFARRVVRGRVRLNYILCARWRWITHDTHSKLRFPPPNVSIGLKQTRKKKNKANWIQCR